MLQTNVNIKIIYFYIVITQIRHFLGDILYSLRISELGTEYFVVDISLRTTKIGKIINVQENKKNRNKVCGLESASELYR
jgi:hypothetical protein